MTILRRDFLKFSIGSTAALGIGFSLPGSLGKVLAAGGSIHVPTYPIALHVYTTLDRTIIPITPPSPYPAQILMPYQISQYAPNQYGEFDGDGKGFPYLRPEMAVEGDVEPSVADPEATPLLSFFAMSDVHIADKESPAQGNYSGYKYPDPKTPSGQSVGSSASYSPIKLYTTHVLDAAIQTINALHKTAPFDFGIALGDAADNTQYNEVGWYVDVIDGKKITPSSGAHKGARTIDYQKPYQAAGLDKSIPWYQAIGNHDQFWSGATHVTDYIRRTLVGSGVLNIGPINSWPPNWSTVLNTRGFYMGILDGSTKYGDVIYAGPQSSFKKPPEITADRNRRSLSVGDWMRRFLNTTSLPVGHGFTPQMAEDEFACYSFHPKAGVPVKVIVLDDTDKIGGGPGAALDQVRYDWLIQELDEGEASGELMIVCAHVPLRPYAPPQDPPPANNPLYPFQTWWNPVGSPYETSEGIQYRTEDEVLEKLHTYKNLMLWVAGHMHRNTITPQPSANGPEYGFWEVETPSLRDFPRQFRRFDIVFNTDNTLSIFALDVDVAANPTPLPNGSASPAWTSLSYAVAAEQIFQTPVLQGPNVDPESGVYNAELVMQLSYEMQEKLASLTPIVSSFKINNGAASTRSRTVTLNNSIVAAKPAFYMASESRNFKGAAWLPYSKAPSFTLGPTRGSGGKTVYFKVKTASGRQSAVVSAGIHG